MDGEIEGADTGENEALPLENVEAAGNDTLPLMEGSEGGEEDSKEPPALVDVKKCCGMPVTIFFILANEFFERFAYYGFKGILAVYLASIIGFSEDYSSAIVSGFTMLRTCSPLAGSVIADSCWGRYKTIWVFFVMDTLGNIIFAITTIPALGGSKGNWYGAIIGLVIIGFSAGGITPNVCTFGADQYAESEADKRVKFFSFFYGAVNVGSLITLAVTPYMKGSVRCFGGPCYFLAFGIPAVLMVVSLIMFIAGGHGGAYVKVPPTGSVFKDTCKCICHALKRRRQERKNGNKEQRRHWLDWADDQYSPEFIADVKSVLRILVVFFVPMPFFWSLYDQQGNRWVLQSRKMDARFGSYVFPVETLQVLNPLLILALIPIFDYGIYPSIKKCKRKDTPLKRMGAGMILALIATLISAFLEKAIEDSSVIEKPSANHALLSLFNDHLQPIQVKVEEGSVAGAQMRSLPPNGELNYEVLKPSSVHSLKIKWGKGTSPKQTCVIPLNNFDPEKSRIVLHFVPKPDGTEVGDSNTACKDKGNVRVFHYFSSFTRPKPFKARISVVSTLKQNLKMKHNNQLGATEKEIHSNARNVSVTTLTLAIGSYKVTVGKEQMDIEILNAGVYAIAAFRSSGQVALGQHFLIDPYSINVFLQVPQIFVMTAGEILVSITGMSFAYSQAPTSMRSLLQALWSLTIFFGNAINLTIFSIEFGWTLWAELFFFSGLMCIAIVAFIVVAKYYKYVEETDNVENLENVDNKED